MTAWLILAAIIIVCLTILMYTRQHKEGFINADIGSNINFANKNAVYFRDSGNKGILTNPGLSLAGLNDAFKQPDIYLQKTVDRDYTSFFQVDPENAYTEQDAAFCKKALGPLDLPARQKNSTVSCGWWFHPTSPSVGALGNANGPVISNGLPAGGKYYWNLKDAALKEDFKNCKRITSCDLIDTPGIKGKCGWCDRLGHAVPINMSGTEKYPDATDEDACGEDVINGAGNCPKPPALPVVTPDGEDCGNYGRPSADNSIRLYTGDECSALGGNPAGNGECLKPQGGSYSWDCRNLNAPIAAQPVVVTTCTPDARGNLSRACLIQVALGLGLSKEGSIYKMLNTTNSPNTNEKLAIKYLSAVGISIPDAVLGSGNIDKGSAANVYMSIYNMMASGKTERLRQSAKLLAVGTAEFDPCTVEDTDVGPFEVDCLQRAFRVAGCQPAGSAYPKAANVADLSSLTWNEINKKFRTAFDTMSNSEPDAQDKAMQECVGFKYTRPDIKQCDAIPADYTPSQGRNFGTVNMTGDYTLSFTITPRGYVGNWANIIRFQAAPGGQGDCCGFGLRSPAIWFWPGDLRLHVRVGDSWDGNWGIDTDPIPVGRPSTFTLECRGRSVRVTVNGRVYAATQPSRRYSGKTVVYGSDPWYPSANANLSNVSYKTL